MSKRTRTRDPLARVFLDLYGANLLAAPREDVGCCELYVKRESGVAPVAGALNELVEPAVVLPPVGRRTPLAKLRGTASDGVDVEFGLGLLEVFLSALGLGSGVVGDVSAHYRHHGARRLAFRFADATRESVDPFALGSALDGRTFKRNHAWVGPGNRYFVSGAVIRSTSISITAEDEHANAIDAAATVAAVVDAKFGVEAKESGELEIAFAGTTALAVGVVLYELRYEEERERFDMRPAKLVERLYLSEGADPVPSFVADDDELLLVLDDPLA